MMEHSYRTAYKDLADTLMAVYPQGEASAISSIVLEELTGVQAGRGLLSDSMFLSQAQALELERITSALLQQEPLQYVLGHADFFGFRLIVNRDVLIPRPETEELAHWIIKALSKEIRTPATALDIGTGSGCLALTLKSAFPAMEVVAADISPAALKVAGANSEKYDLDISFLQMDILQTQSDKLLPDLDLVVSNPPYIMPVEAASMLPNVLQYEPHSALFVTDGDPLQFYKAIERFCRNRLTTKGSIYLELNAAQAPGIEAHYRDQGWDTVLKTDFQGLPRMLKASRRV